MQISGISAISYFNKKKISSTSSYSTKPYANDSVSFTANKTITAKKAVEKAIKQTQEAFKKLDYDEVTQYTHRNGNDFNSVVFNHKGVKYLFADMSPEQSRNGKPVTKDFELKIESSKDKTLYKVSEEQFNKAGESISDLFRKKIFKKAGVSEDKEKGINELALKIIKGEIPLTARKTAIKDNLTIRYDWDGFEFFQTPEDSKLAGFTQIKNFKIKKNKNSHAFQALDKVFVVQSHELGILEEKSKIEDYNEQILSLNKYIETIKNSFIPSVEGRIKQREGIIEEENRDILELVDKIQGKNKAK